MIDSREAKGGRSVRRRRVCPKCNERFTTYEEIEVVHLAVIKRDGKKEEYKRKKIEEGLRRSLKKRPINNEQIEQILNDIEYEIRSKEKLAITSREIGRIVMNKLREVDDVAFIRFASVYKSVGSVDSFRRVIQDLMKDV